MSAYILWLLCCPQCAVPRWRNRKIEGNDKGITSGTSRLFWNRWTRNQQIWGQIRLYLSLWGLKLDLNFAFEQNSSLPGLSKPKRYNLKVGWFTSGFESSCNTHYLRSVGSEFSPENGSISSSLLYVETELCMNGRLVAEGCSLCIAAG